jgi:hypothetical protein
MMWLWNYVSPSRSISPRTFVEVVGAFLLLAIARAFDDYKRRPRIEFYRDPRVNPYFEEFLQPGGTRVRYLRIGLRNTGDIDLPRVWLILEACSQNSPAVHLEARLQPTGRAPGDSEFTVAAHGTTVVDVLIENVSPSQEWGTFSFAYANLPGNIIQKPEELIRLTLRAEGGGAVRRCTLDFGNRLAWRLDGLRTLP